MVESVAPASATALRAEPCAELTTLTADLGDRGRQFLGAGRDALHIGRGLLGGGGHRAPPANWRRCGGRGHALRRGLHGIGRGAANCRAPSGDRGPRTRTIRASIPRGALGPWRRDPCPARLDGGARGLDHALAGKSPAASPIAAISSRCFERWNLGVRDRPSDNNCIERCRPRPIRRRMFGADIAPDETAPTRSGSQRPAASMTMLAKRKSSWRAIQVAPSGVLLPPPATSACTLDVEADIELAGFLQHGSGRSRRRRAPSGEA